MTHDKNEGTLDRVGRGLLVLVFLTLGITRIRSLRGKVFLGLAAMMGMTAATGSCAVYSVIGLDTRDSCSVGKVRKHLGL